MPRDATGTYTLPLAPFVAGTLAKAGDVNTQLSDLAAGLTDSWSRSNPSPAQGDLNLNGHNITNLGTVQGGLVATQGVWANNQLGGFGFFYDGISDYVFNWGVPSYYDTFSTTDGLRTWTTPGGNVMTLSYGGNLTTTGTVSAASVSTAGAVTGASLSTTGTVQGDHVIASRSGSGGTVGSYCVSWGVVGFGSDSAGKLIWGQMDGSANLISSRMTLDASSNMLVGGTVQAGGALLGASLSVTGAVASGSVSATGNVSAGGAITSSGTVTGVISARGPGVAYPNISALGSGQAHSFGFDYGIAGRVAVYVDGGFAGNIALTARTESLDDRLAALEARIAALGG